MSTTAIRLSDETITALAKVLESRGAIVAAYEAIQTPEERVAYEMGVVKLVRAASDIVHADTAADARPSPRRRSPFAQPSAGRRSATTTTSPTASRASPPKLWPRLD
jgi:hypothetical protein